MDVTLEPGEGHDFHRHPGQEEMIIVKQRPDHPVPGAGVDRPRARDSVFIEADVVHASFNEGDETAVLQVIIAPSLGEGSGYGAGRRLRRGALGVGAQGLLNRDRQSCCAELGSARHLTRAREQVEAKPSAAHPLAREQHRGRFEVGA